MSEAHAPQAATAPPAPAAAASWPSLEPIAPGSPIFEVWGGFAAPCPECAFMFVEKTPKAAREAVTYREDIHGRDYCRQAATKLSAEKKEWLRRLYNEPAAPVLSEGAERATGRKRAAKQEERPAPAPKRTRSKGGA